MPSNPYTRDGYTFAGWNTLADGTGTNYIALSSYSNLTTIDGATVTLFAKWNIVTYSITYIMNDGINNAGNPLSYDIEDEEIVLLDPTPYSKTGYIVTFNE
jgi:uncharacterized repeat protein (TIGR02543 family)